MAWMGGSKCEILLEYHDLTCLKPLKRGAYWSKTARYERIPNENAHIRAQNRTEAAKSMRSEWFMLDPTDPNLGFFSVGAVV